MEIIEFTSYLKNDKIRCQAFLIPKEKENNSLTKVKITFTKSALQKLLRYYVRAESEIYKGESVQFSVK